MIKPLPKPSTKPRFASFEEKKEILMILKKNPQNGLKYEYDLSGVFPENPPLPTNLVKRLSFLQLLLYKSSFIMLDLHAGMLKRDLYRRVMRKKHSRRILHEPEHLFPTVKLLEKEDLIKLVKNGRGDTIHLTLKGVKMQEYLKNIEKALLKGDFS